MTAKRLLSPTLRTCRRSLGGVIATTTFHQPNYLSISGDRWVSSNGTIMTCEELFEELAAKKDTELDYLSNYDFQVM